MQKWKTKKLLELAGIGLGILAVTEVGASAYFYNIALKRSTAKKERTMKMSGTDWNAYAPMLRERKEYFLNQPRKDVYIKSGDGLKLHATFLPNQNAKKVVIPTVLTAAPKVLETFEKTEYAARLKATGVITSYICPLMYMNNPLCKKMPVITSSNKLRTYTSARYYTDEEILSAITNGGK